MMLCEIAHDAGVAEELAQIAVREHQVEMVGAGCSNQNPIPSCCPSPEYGVADLRPFVAYSREAVTVSNQSCRSTARARYAWIGIQANGLG